MVDYKEIPESVLLQSAMPVVIQKFRNKALAYKLLKEVDLKFETVKGARVSADRFLFDSLGEVSVELAGMPGLVLKFSGTGEYKREERRVYLTGFKILNDVTGFANKLIEGTGISVGRSLSVTEQDDELLLSLFPEESV
ncbi:MAG TPA: hypothetical protein VNR65_05785 [Geobacterales bacterium]|nr:hypothetical protein [Geobacterales bacterium]